ncbi:hypothetical protein V8G54_023734 [Vigna mungo]|uniref:Protein kinase domain-containing protein n=1 Tax=Vigna mungo TaxID=3915 RepID=A0AAQ3RRW3_VIGMU
MAAYVASDPHFTDLSIFLAKAEGRRYRREREEDRAGEDGYQTDRTVKERGRAEEEDRAVQAGEDGLRADRTVGSGKEGEKTVGSDREEGKACRIVKGGNCRIVKGGNCQIVKGGNYGIVKEEKKLENLELSMRGLETKMEAVYKGLQELLRKMKERARQSEENSDGSQAYVNGKKEDQDRGCHEEQQNWRKGVELPIFDGVDPLNWVSRADNFFELQGMSEEEKLRLAYISMEKKARYWFRFWKRNAKNRSWEGLKEAMVIRFVEGNIGSVFERLAASKQSGIREEYVQAPNGKELPEPNCIELTNSNVRELPEPDGSRLLDPNVREWAEPKERGPTEPNRRGLPEPDGSRLLDPNVREWAEPKERGPTEPNRRGRPEPTVRKLLEPNGLVLEGRMKVLVGRADGKINALERTKNSLKWWAIEKNRGLVVFDTPVEGRARREVLKDIEDHFLKTYGSGKRVNRILDEEWKTLEEVLPPPKPTDLNWRTTDSEYRPYDNTRMKRSQEIKFHSSSLEDKVVLKWMRGEGIGGREKRTEREKMGTKLTERRTEWSKQEKTGYELTERWVAARKFPRCRNEKLIRAVLVLEASIMLQGAKQTNLAVEPKYHKPPRVHDPMMEASPIFKNEEAPRLRDATELEEWLMEAGARQVFSGVYVDSLTQTAFQGASKLEDKCAKKAQCIELEKTTKGVKEAYWRSYTAWEAWGARYSCQLSSSMKKMKSAPVAPLAFFFALLLSLLDNFPKMHRHATTGLRLLNGDAAENILQAVREMFKNISIIYLPRVSEQRAAAQLLSGLNHCHSRGALHRDIKGSNLLIDNNGTLKIADFGLANFIDPHHKVSLTSRVVTLWYRPPELLLGASNYGVAVDLWSTGCILGDLYCGRPILPGKTEVEQLHRIFKLCGSPSEGYWLFRPPHHYRRCVAETFKEYPSAATKLIESLLALDPTL